MVHSIEDLLETLETPGSKLSFLRDVYVPGDSDIAQRILELDPADHMVIGGELPLAFKNGDTEKFKEFAKLKIQNYLQGDHDILIGSDVITWDDVDLGRVAIDILSSRDSYRSWGYAADVADHFGFEDEARDLREKVYQADLVKLRENQENKDHSYPGQTARLAAEAGRFNEAIDLFLEDEYYYHGSALKLAQEHDSERANTIAERIWGEYNSKNNRQGLLVLAGKQLGKESVVARKLKWEVLGLSVNQTPRMYGTLVKALVDIGLEKQAAKIVEKVSVYVQRAPRESPYGRGDELKELASLYETIGDSSGVVWSLKLKVDAQMPSHHPSCYLEDIDSIVGLTADPSLLQKKPLVYARRREFSQAAIEARKIGDENLASKYDSMNEMISSAQVARKS